MAEETKRGNGKEYTAASFESHEGLDGVRTRPTVYIGSIGREGVYRMFLEGLGNEIDEFNAGRLNEVNIQIDSTDKTHFIIEDHALGIPIEVFHDALTKLHTGGKFGKSTYDYSIGLNGLGLKCINALSEKFIVDTVYRGKHGHFESEKSIEKKFWIEDDDKSPTGTRVEWIPDLEVLEELGADFGRYSNMMDMNVYINAGLKLNLIWDNKPFTFYHPEGLLGYFSNVVVKKNKFHMLAQPITFSGNQSLPHPTKPDKFINMSYSVYFSWAENGHGEYIESYVNGLRTINGGSHVTGVHMAITKAIKDYIDKNNLLPKNAKFEIDGNDVRDTLVLIVSAKHSAPKYTTQVKDAMDNKDIQFFTSTSLYPQLQNWLADHKKEADNICKVVIRSAKARQAAKDAKENVIKATSGRIGIVGINPKKYAGCSSRNPEECELFIVEGDSAFGSVKPARDTRYQACFAVRGKGQNVIDTNVTKLSDEHQMLAEILGCGIGSEFDIRKLKFHKIILSADSDADGSDIRRILCGFFLKYYPEIIKAGYLYEALPPLFQITVGTGKSSKTLYLQDQNIFDTVVGYTASEAFDMETIGTGKKLSKSLIKLYVKKVTGFHKLLEGYSAHTGLDPELLEYIVRYYNDICKCDFKKLQSLDYDCSILTKSSTHLHFNIDRGYEHYFCVLDNNFYQNVYLPIAKKMTEILLMDVCFVGKQTGIKYGGNCYRNAKFIESLLINNQSRVNRIKGLGESNPVDVANYLLYPETRVLRQITLNDVDAANNAASVCLGKDIDNRKKLCMTGTY